MSIPTGTKGWGGLTACGEKRGLHAHVYDAQRCTSMGAVRGLANEDGHFGLIPKQLDCMSFSSQAALVQYCISGQDRGSYIRSLFV